MVININIIDKHATTEGAPTIVCGNSDYTVRFTFDAGLILRKVGTDEEYGEAIDVEDSGYTYEETDKPIDIDEDTIKEEDYEQQ